MISQRPRPLNSTRGDDNFVRPYRNLLLELTAAGDDETLQNAAIATRPDVYDAHRLHYSPDFERRAILQARLLTSETFAEIAGRFATTPKAIDYFEKLFFHVRDRLQNRDWIVKTIVGSRDSYRRNKTGGMTAEERGYVYRLFGYFGGPLALDAVISGSVATTMPRGTEEIDDWFNGALNQIVRTTAAAAAATLRLNKQNMFRVMKLALRTSAAAATSPTEPADSPDWDKIHEALKKVFNGYR
jgi:hypothetical protein